MQTACHTELDTPNLAATAAGPTGAGRQVLILGAAGRFGRAAAHAFAAAGWQVVMQQRRSCNSVAPRSKACRCSPAC
jgi:NADPH:quinone reductase-like Zn-dependent oxidoreductase